MKVITCFLCFIVYGSSYAQSQELESSDDDSKFSFSAYLGLFYAYDFNQPQTDYRQPFFFNQNRHNETNVNLGLIRASIEQAKYHAYLGLQVGTYAIDNYAAESNIMQHIYEAFGGVSLNEQNTLWLDAGIFSSHLGFESAISMDNWTLTRSLAAESSPFFLTGAKLTYNIKDDWTIAITVANGWQRIRRVPGNSLPSIGTQVVYKTEGTTLNWSTLVGTDDPDSTRRIRVFNNLYGIFELSNRVRVIAGFDIGLQQTSIDSSEYNYWWIPTAIVQYDLNEKLSSSIRVEYVSDENEVIVSSENPITGFSTSGVSFNLDYYPVRNVACRIESRLLSSKYELFPKNNAFSSQNFVITGSIAFRFE
ncbi:MAG: porin [Reichenbachiella sp.]